MSAQIAADRTKSSRRLAIAEFSSSPDELSVRIACKGLRHQKECEDDGKAGHLKNWRVILLENPVSYDYLSFLSRII